MKAELGGFPHGADEQQDADNGQGMAIDPKDDKAGVCQTRNSREDIVETDRAEKHEGRTDAQGEADVADAVYEEGLDRRRAGTRPLVPETDLQVGLLQRFTTADLLDILRRLFLGDVEHVVDGDDAEELAGGIDHR